MSNDINDDWLNEKGRETFDFELLELGNLTLQEGVSYFPTPRGVFRQNPRLNVCQSCLAYGFSPQSLDRLAAALEAAQETVRFAMDRAEAEAFEAFQYGHSLWSFCENSGPVGTEQPAQVLIEALDAFGPPDGFTSSELCASVGLWLLGEIVASEGSARAGEIAEWAEIEALRLLAESHWYRGKLEGLQEGKGELAARNRMAAHSRHAVTNKRKEKARVWYVTKGKHLPTKAAAAKEISEQYSCAYEVAKRWVTGFSRGMTRPHPKNIG